jgi:sugar phosphate isomerase/epimerase
MPSSDHEPSVLSRRSFLGAAGAGTLALALGGAAASAGPKKTATVPDSQIGIQLFTCTALAQAAMPVALTVLAELGYQVVEHAGYGVGQDAKSFRAALDDAGLRCVSGHTDIPHPYDDKVWRKAVQDALVVGQKHIVCPSKGGLATVKDWEAYARTLNRAGKVARQMGLVSVGHHNHTGEFTVLPGSKLRPIDIYLRQTNPAFVQPELDLGWAYAGLGSVEKVQGLLRQYPKRFSQFHVKDIRNGAPTRPGLGEIGKEGFARVFGTARETRQPIRAYHIEDDTAVLTCVDAGVTGYQMLHGMTYTYEG